MEDYRVKYGGSFDLTVETDDETATLATLYVGYPGKPSVITVPATMKNGIGQIQGLPADTRVPLGKYNYQVNVSYSDGRVFKIPNSSCCDEDELPVFEIVEALDETEVVS